MYVANQEQVLQSYLGGLLGVEWGDDVAESDGAEPTEEAKTHDEKHPTIKQKAADMVSTFSNVDKFRESTARPGVDKYLHVQPLAVVGLRLALASEHIAAINPFPAEVEPSVVPVPGVLGMCRSEGRELTIIDSAAVFVPRRHPRYTAIVAKKDYRHLIVLRDSDYALACDEIDEDVILPMANLRNREERGQHPWLKGVFTEFGYALIDPQRLADLTLEARAD